MKTLLQRLAARPGVFLALLGASLIINTLALAQPVFVIQVLNRYVAHGVDSTLATLTIGALIAVALEFGFRQVRMRFTSVVAIKPDEMVSLTNFRLLATAKLQVLENVPEGMRRQFLNGAEVIAQAYSGPNIATLLDLPFAILYLGVLYLLSPVLAIIAAVIAVGMLMIGLVGTAGLGAAAAELVRQGGEGGRHVGSVIGAADTVRAFNARVFLVHAWQSHLRHAQGLANRIAARRGFLQSVTQSVTAAQGIVIICVGAVLVLRQELDVGAMIGANILAARALATVTRFSMLGEHFAKANTAAQLFKEFHRLPQDLAEGSALGDFHGGVTFKDVAFAYPGSKTPLFETLNLELQPGNILLVSGANGSGKTTFCKMLAGLLEPTRGEVLVDGVDLRQIVPEWWHAQVRYMPQEPMFLNASVKDNLSTLAPGIDDGSLNGAIEAAALKSFISESKDGFNTLITDNGRTLSLGIRRRLALARALTSNGRLVVFDEPTEALDVEGREALYTVLNEMSREVRTIVVCSDDPYVTKAAHFTLDLNQKPVPRIVPNPEYHDNSETGAKVSASPETRPDSAQEAS